MFERDFAETLRLSFFIPHLHGGGMERVTVFLIKGLIARGFPVDLVLVNRGEGAYQKEIPRMVRSFRMGYRIRFSVLFDHMYGW